MLEYLLFEKKYFLLNS